MRVLGKVGGRYRVRWSEPVAAPEVSWEGAASFEARYPHLVEAFEAGETQGSVAGQEEGGSHAELLNAPRTTRRQSRGRSPDH